MIERFIKNNPLTINLIIKGLEGIKDGLIYSGYLLTGWYLGKLAVILRIMKV